MKKNLKGLEAKIVDDAIVYKNWVHYLAGEQIHPDIYLALQTLVNDLDHVLLVIQKETNASV